MRRIKAVGLMGRAVGRGTKHGRSVQGEYIGWVGEWGLLVGSADCFRVNYQIMKP